MDRDRHMHKHLVPRAVREAWIKPQLLLLPPPQGLSCCHTCLSVPEGACERASLLDSLQGWLKLAPQRLRLGDQSLFNSANSNRSAQPDLRPTTGLPPVASISHWRRDGLRSKPMSEWTRSYLRVRGEWSLTGLEYDIMHTASSQRPRLCIGLPGRRCDAVV